MNNKDLVQFEKIFLSRLPVKEIIQNYERFVREHNQNTSLHTI